MAKVSIYASVNAFCNENVERIEYLNPRQETYNFEVEQIVDSLQMKHNSLFKRSTVERAIRQWKAKKRLTNGQ